MADKIPIYGELDCRTEENIIADATQIRYDATKNVKEKIEELETGGGGGGITGFTYCTFSWAKQDSASDARWTFSFSCVIPSNVTPRAFLKKLTIVYNISGHYKTTTLSTGKTDDYMVESIQYLQLTTKKLRVTILDRDGSTWYEDLSLDELTLDYVDI